MPFPTASTPAALLLLMILAGCAGGPGDPSGPAPSSTGPVPAGSSSGTATGDGPASRPASAPPMEVLNSSYVFPRAGTGSQASDSFNVPDRYSFLNATVTTTRDCPAGYYNTPGIAFKAPDGTETRRNLLGEGSTVAAYPCAGIATLSLRLWETTAMAGAWTLQTYGECTCSVRLAIVVAP